MEPSDVLLWSLSGLRKATATIDRTVSEGDSSVFSAVLNFHSCWVGSLKQMASCLL